MNKIRRAACSTVFLIGLQSVMLEPLAGQTARISAEPILRLRSTDANMEFTGRIAGAVATRDGVVVVGQNGGEYALLLYNSVGRLINKLGRTGDGPGEVNGIDALLFCSDSLFVVGSSGQRVDVFGPDLRPVRRFGFRQPVQRIACNNRGDFLLAEWEDMRKMVAGAFRPTVRYSLAKADSARSVEIAMLPGSERFGMFRGGKPIGIAPLLLGRTPSIALSDMIAFIALGDSYSVSRYSRSGAAMTSLQVPGRMQAATSTDRDYAIMRELGRVPEGERASTRSVFREMPTPTYLPAVAALVLDDRNQLWVRSNQKVGSDLVTWHVTSSDAGNAYSVALPRNLDVLAVVRDQLIARWTQPDGDEELRVYSIVREPGVTKGVNHTRR